MAELVKTNGRTVVDYMARDYDSLLRSMRELIPRKMPEWTDYESEADLGNVLLELFAHMGDILSYYQDRVANESFLGTAQTRRSIIHHLRLIGYRLSTAAPASAELVLTLPPADPERPLGPLTVRRGDAFATKSQKNAASVRFEYNGEHDLEIRPEDLKNVMDGDRVVAREFRSVPVEEGRLVEDELLGTSDGTADQSFPLAHGGLILRSLGQGQAINRDVFLTTHLGDTVTPWTLKETLAFSQRGRSQEGQHDFILDVDENDRATIRFGDGVFGAIPRTDSEVRVTYRVGGGLHGNVPAHSIQTLADAPDLALAGAKVTNPAPATGGAERESIRHAVDHAPAVFRSLKRAVTAEDYKALALEFSGVGKVRAEATSWNVVTLYVAPEGGGPVSDVLEANLLAYFEDKRILTTTLEIEDVDYVPVYVTAEIGVIGYYTPAAVREQVRAAGGALLAFDNVDFGKAVYLSKFFEAIEAIEGVEFVNISEFRRYDSEALFESHGRIVMGVNEIPVAPLEVPGYEGGIQVLLPEEVEG